MSQLKFGSAGVTAREIDLTGPVAQQPVGVPAGIIGTAVKGPAFVPVTVGLLSDFTAKFGPTDGKKFGPLAANEWLRNASALTYVRVLGVGDGKTRAADGSVNYAGFTVGENEPAAGKNLSPSTATATGLLQANPFANSGGPPGRTYVLGAFMSESAGSTIFSQAGVQGAGTQTGTTGSIPVVRGILMVASGVIARLSSSIGGFSSQPGSTMVATEALASGSSLGTVYLLQNSVVKQDFVLILNGHKGSDPQYPNVITASFDMTSPNYFANVLNSDPTNLNPAGHFLYAHWDIHSAAAVVTGSGIISQSAGLNPGGTGNWLEQDAFLLTSSLSRNTGNTTVPNLEGWNDRFTNARSPWVVSQRFGGQAHNLFRLWALDAGAGVSTMFKLSIENIAPSTGPANQYGTFDLIIRDWNDNDTTVAPLEQWRGLSLNPSDDRYIAKVIGDLKVYYDFDRAESAQRLVVEGNYPNNSNLVRVEVDSTVDQGTLDPTALPFGVRGALHLVTSGSAPMSALGWTAGTSVPNNVLLANAGRLVIEPPVPFRGSLVQGPTNKTQVNPLLYWGVQFEHFTDATQQNGSILRNKSLNAFAGYFPEFSTTNINMVVGDNAGVADTAANGILDSDRFCRNLFTLENIQVVTSSAGTADPNSWASAVYVRDGNIVANNTSYTRRVTTADFIQANRRYLKYSFFMQGGNDGTNIFDLDESQINNNAVVADMNDTNRGQNLGANVRAYTKALDIMKNTTIVDVQLLAIPGIRHPIVTNSGVDACQTRFDAMFVMDVEQLDSQGNNIISDSQLPSVQLTAAQVSARALNSSFAAAYFPDVVMPDPTTQNNVVAPPSVVVLGALALNDAVGHPWFAPAGFTRGSLQTTLEARVKLSKTNMDTLYDVNVNPLVAFPGNSQSGTNPTGGVIVWGQKTLQAAASALDRVNVRRLLIEIRREVRDIANTIIFEPNREATLAKFSALVTPKLQRVQALAGLQRFRVVIDSSTTTQADVQNNTIRGKIYVQPTKSLEYVSLDFVVTNNVSQTA